VSAEHPRAGIVLRLVTATPGEPTARPVAPALDASLAAARDALSDSMRRGALACSERIPEAVALLKRSLRTRSRADVLSLASTLAALAVEGIDDAASCASDAWSDRADDASRLARAAAVLLASLPRVPR